MTVPAPQRSVASRRLWALAVTLTCCFTVYVIIMPMLYRRLAVGWPLTVVAVAADVLAVGLAAVVLVLRGRQAADLRDVADRAQLRIDEQVDRRNAEFLQRDRQFRQQSAELEKRLAAGAQALREALGYMATVQLPAALDGAAVPPMRPDGFDESMAELLDRTVALAASAGYRQESTRTAVVALSRRVQTSAHRIQEEATLMADRRPGDADVLEVSMRVDHAAAQQARHAQSMAVLCGNWPGQQWHDPLPLVDVVRAAAGRIIAYQRIEVAGDPDVAVTAPVVEPAIHLVAELLANATQSAPPPTTVPVTIRPVQRGAVIEIHDCGVGLDDHRLKQAQEVASGRRPVGLDTLGEYPQTGLAVVGQYARRYGFRVDVSESVYGGVRVLVGVPAEVVEVVAPAGTAAAAQSFPQPGVNGTGAVAQAMGTTTGTADPGAADSGAADQGSAAPVPAEVAHAGAGQAEAATGGEDDGDLPRRRSRRHARDGAHPLADRVPAQRGKPVPDPQTPGEAGAWMGAFLSPDPPAGTSGTPPSAGGVPDVPSQSETQERR